MERLLHYLEQIDRDNNYYILVREQDRNYWKPTNSNFEVKIADFAPYSFSEQIGFFFYLKKLRPDLVHFTMPHQPVLYSGLKVTTIHDLTLLKTYNSDKNWIIYHFKQLVGRFVFSSVIKKSAYVICSANFTRDEIITRYNIAKRRIITTHLAAEMKTTKQTPYSLPSQNFIMYVGQQSDYKNIRRLGDAHQQLLGTHPDLHLVLAGKVDEAARRNQAYFEKHRYRNILFTGFIEDDQLNWLYANTKAYVFPSLMEGFGFPGLEAMLHDTPVISSNATCLPEVYGEAAYYFNPLDTSDMSRAIGEVLESEDLRKRLVTSGRKQVQKYSWEKTAEQTLAVYKSALGSE